MMRLNFPRKGRDGIRIGDIQNMRTYGDPKFCHPRGNFDQAILVQIGEGKITGAFGKRGGE